MKYSKLKTGHINGFGVDDILVEIDINSKTTHQIFKVVGMPGTSVVESEKRVLSSLRNSGYNIPHGTIIVNLSPSSIKKEGPHFDLPIAAAVLEASGQIAQLEDNMYLFGEIGLNGEVRPVNGITLFLMCIKEKNSQAKFIIPRGNEEETYFIAPDEVFVIDNIRDIEEIKLYPEKFIPNLKPSEKSIYECDFSEIKGQYFIKRSAEIAASGFHNLIMRGSPGSGKTMIARRIPTIMPDMTKEEIIESTKLYSISGYVNMVMDKRPFRTPHHTASSASIIGGGSIPKPGEISLAHNGVLFLDEFPEFKTDVVESLRQPLEDGFVTVTRSKAVAVYPARFMLVAAQNPCPCGFYGDKEHECTCNMTQILNYNKKISGPIMDRIDIRLDVPRVDILDLMDKSTGESSEKIKERVMKTAGVQIMRQGKLNGKLSNKELKEYAILSDKAESFLKEASINLKLSARSVNRILRVSRTIADSFESKTIEIAHISEALNYRGKDTV